MKTHNIKKLMFICVGSIMGMLSPILAQAGCSQGDLAGTWYMYSMSADSFLVFDTTTNRCKLKFNSSGSIVASKSTCKVRSWEGTKTVNITDGSIKVTSGCRLSGTVDISSDISGDPDVVVLEYGSLSKDKTTFSAVGYSANLPDYISHITAVKK